MTAECPLCGHVAPFDHYVDGGCPECSTPFLTLLDHGAKQRIESERSS